MAKWQMATYRQQQQQQHHHITTTTTTSKSITREKKPHFLYLKQKATRYSLSKRPSLGKKGTKVEVKTNIPQPHSILFLTLVNFCGWETDATRFNKPGKAPKKAVVVDH
jgi:hypothetical protein